MPSQPPRLASVAVTSPATLTVTWDTGDAETINLAGWIATGGDLLATLGDATIFGTARVGDYGASVDWGGPDDDLAIDSVHLSRIAEEQRAFGRAQFLSWQDEMGLSNQEAADFLGIALSTLNAYRAGARVPQQTAMLCRAATRDPILMHAFYRPRRIGRPRKAASIAQGM